MKQFWDFAVEANLFQTGQELYQPILSAQILAKRELWPHKVTLHGLIAHPVSPRRLVYTGGLDSGCVLLVSQIHNFAMSYYSETNLRQHHDRC